jgi:hypothetical protein
VTKPGQQSRLAFELPPQAILNRKGLFDRDGDLKSLVQGFINRAHTAGAELPHHAIATLQDFTLGKHVHVLQLAAKAD